jgi:RIO kinase 2
MLYSTRDGNVLEDVAQNFKDLQGYDFRVIGAVEVGMRYFDWVPVEEIPKYSRLPKDEVNYRLKRVLKFKMVQRKTTHYTGFKLTFTGYDALAVNTLVKRNAISALGSRIGVGKESDIYGAKRDERVVAVKLHREGLTFKHVKRARGHLFDRDRYSWLLVSKLAAEREFRALNELYPTVSVPEPIDYNRHILVMGLVNGIDLVKVDLKDPEYVLDLIFIQIKSAYEQKIIHSDLSEYNVMITADGTVTIIDWPQYVYVSHPNSKELLTRDVNNILSFFRRKFGIRRSFENVLSYITTA